MDRTSTPALSWLLACVLVGVTIGLRLPTWNDRILFIDEPAYYSLAARLEVPGAHLYTHTLDFKPPLGPLTYWLALNIDPAHAIAVVHILTSLSIALTATLLVASTQLLLGGPLVGFLAGLLYTLISSSTAPGQEPWFAFSSLEHFQAPWLVGFILLFVLSLRSARVRLAVAAGASLGVAALYKPNVPVLLGPAAVVAVTAAWRGKVRRARAVALTVAAGVSTIVVAGAAPLYYAALGHFDAWWFDNVTLLAVYHAVGGPYRLEAQLLAGLIPLRLFLAGGILYAVLGVARRRAGWPDEFLLFLALGWLALFASLAAGQHKGNYVVQALALQCVLVAVLVVDGWSYVVRVQPRLRVLLGVFHLALVVGLANAGFATYRGWRMLDALIATDDYLAIHRHFGTLGPIVDYVRRHSGQDDLVYIHSQAPEFYFLTQRRPAAGDPAGTWIGEFPAPLFADRLLRDLEATPPRLIIQFGYRRYGHERELLQNWPRLWDWINAHYRARATVPYAQIFEWQPP